MNADLIRQILEMYQQNILSKFHQAIHYNTGKEKVCFVSNKQIIIQMLYCCFWFDFCFYLSLLEWDIGPHSELHLSGWLNGVMSHTMEIYFRYKMSYSYRQVLKRFLMIKQYSLRGHQHGCSLQEDIRLRKQKLWTFFRGILAPRTINNWVTFKFHGSMKYMSLFQGEW